MTESIPKYCLLDANVTAAYYLPRSTKSRHVRDRIEVIFNSRRSRETDFFFYLPNFCVAEVFSVFMKYSFGNWNRHVSRTGTLDTRIYRKLVAQFQDDIHNGKFIYHYELARYHVLAMNLVAPVDHYFQISRARRNSRANVAPAGTFDHLIIAMGIHLSKIHGSDNVVILSADSRLTNVLAKCKSGLPYQTREKLKLNEAENLTGIKFEPKNFPHHINLKDAKKADLIKLFGMWPLATKEIENVYRYLS